MMHFDRPGTIVTITLFLTAPQKISETPHLIIWEG